jgi:hydroxyacylglutathione hydrolase
MKIETIPVMGDNYAYLVICEETGQAAAVDPADPGEVADRVQQLGLRLTQIWNTHHHFDHTGGNQELISGRQLRVVGHESDAGRIPGLNESVKHGAEIELGSLTARVLHTPGHTMGAVCYLVQDVLLTGDTLFGGGCGRLFEGQPADMYRSLNQVLGELPDKTWVYFGHEYTEKNLGFARLVEPKNPRLQQRFERCHQYRDADQPTTPSTLGIERQTNPFLRCESPEIRETIAGRYPGDELTPLQVFTRLRQMRNSW